jgi:predicted transposase YdaD
VLLFVVTAAILGAEQARRIFEMDAIIQSPGVQDLVHRLRDEGRAEGRVEGRLEQARDLLLRQFRARFGEVPAAAVERVQTAALAELNCWAERVLTATTVEEVFTESSR